jgi:hypothetical protein
MSRDAEDLADKNIFKKIVAFKGKSVENFFMGKVRGFAQNALNCRFS